MRAHDQSSIFITGGKFHPDYGLLLELHALTLVAHSYLCVGVGVGSNFIFGGPNIIYSDLRCMYKYK